jgi:class 3 adenylate cyclase/nitrite reductase/ring-hydroxylating ferredoxin subunit/CDGSH-type Zn-finger protein
MNMNEPFAIEVEEGKNYFWCSCGKSNKQPFCDGSHAGSEYEPLNFAAKETKIVYFCGCKVTKNVPFCDGSHQTLLPFIEGDKSFSVHIQPDNKKINITEEESILIASLRNNISHLSACGGNGKCSTCRVEVTTGLENCFPRNEVEQKLADKLSFPDNIRLACQTKLKGDVTYRRVLLDKRDVDLNSQITDQRLESAGTLRNLTILFCDIKGFTTFSETLSAYDVIFILNRYFSIMREVIIRHGGEINNYIGDAILAIFGLKESRQQALRAVSASLEMLKAMDEFKSYLNKAYGSDFDIRVGLHYGEVISGSVGQGDDKKMTVIGDAVNVASRIEAINKEAGTRFLISETVYEQVKDNVVVRNYLRLRLRGTSNLITLHEISDMDNNILQLNITEVERTIDDKTWHRTLPISELSEGEKKKYKIKDKEILLINQGEVFAIENRCPHMDLPLDIGQITHQGTILCPYHNSEFCFKSGEVRKWVGKQPDSYPDKCNPLNTIQIYKDEDYIWVADE